MIAPSAKPQLLALAACVWWIAVVFIDLIQNAPSPYGDIRWLDWRQMAVVYRIAPWMCVPFAAFAVWGLARRVLRGAPCTASSLMTWMCGAAALLWTFFILWRAHDQAFKCALWAPREEFWSIDSCFMPNLLVTALPWLAIPIGSWLVLAALPLMRLPFAPLKPAS